MTVFSGSAPWVAGPFGGGVMGGRRRLLTVVMALLVLGSGFEPIAALPGVNRARAAEGVRLSPLAASLADGQLDRLLDVFGGGSAKFAQVASRERRDAGVVIDGPGFVPPARVIGSSVSTRERWQLPASPVAEVVSKRAAKSEVWANSDGTESLRVFQRSKWFKPTPSSEWQLIDTSVVPDAGRPGWLRTSANSLVARFGPLTPADANGNVNAGGVEYTTATGVTVGLRPEFVRPGPPIVPEAGSGDKANTVTYRDVLAGVDVVYTVEPDAVKEDIVIRELPATLAARTALGSLTFGVLGAEFTANPDGSLQGVGAAAGVRFAAATVMGKDLGNLDVVAKPTQVRTVRPDVAGQKAAAVTVTVDAEFLGSLTAADLPVSIDPTLIVNDSNTHHWQTRRSDGTSDCVDCGWYWVGYQWNTRSLRQFVWWDYASILGKQVTSAKVYAQFLGGSGAYPLSTFEANPQFSGNTGSPGWTYSGIGAGPYQTKTIPTDGSWHTLDVTPLYQAKVPASDPYATVALKGDESGAQHQHRCVQPVFGDHVCERESAAGGDRESGAADRHGVGAGFADGAGGSGGRSGW